MKKPVLATALLAALLAVSALAAGPAAAPIAPVAPATPEAATAGSLAPFLWFVQGPKARHALLGSVHLLPASAHPLPAALGAAYDASKALVLETDLDALSDPELQNRMLSAARDDRRGGLKSRIGPALYARLQKRAGALGMPLPACEDLRGWFCALTLELYPLQQAQFSAEFGLDQFFYARAQEDGKPVEGLETAAQQTALFTDIGDALSSQMVSEALDEHAYASQTPEEFLRIWREGDAATMEKMMKDMKRRYPKLYERLLASRNRAWLPQLVEKFNGDAPVLVVVGAGHLVGPEGLVAALKSKGFAVTAAPAAAPSP